MDSLSSAYRKRRTLSDGCDLQVQRMRVLLNFHLVFDHSKVGCLAAETSTSARLVRRSLDNVG